MVYKYFFIGILFFYNISFATVSPIFDGRRDIWMFRNEIPIAMYPGFKIGLTKSSLGYCEYEFKLKTVYGHIKYEVPISDNNSFIINDNNFRVNGFFDGTGNPLSNVVVYGYGTVEVYKKDFSINEFEYIGKFQVIPEPYSISFLLSGIIFWRKNNAKI